VSKPVVQALYENLLVELPLASFFLSKVRNCDAVAGI
jgi:hypothetical protein